MVSWVLEPDCLGLNPAFTSYETVNRLLDLSVLGLLIYNMEGNNNVYVVL